MVPLPMVFILSVSVSVCVCMSVHVQRPEISLGRQSFLRVCTTMPCVVSGFGWFCSSVGLALRPCDAASWPFAYFVLEAGFTA